MKAILLKTKISLGILTLFLNFLACDGNKKSSGTNVGQVEITEQEELKISDIEVNLVELDHKIVANDTSYTQAWLVQFKIQNLPNYYGSKIDFYIGDYKIPEYGGTKDGIYFRIFEKDKLRRLDSEEIRYKYETSEEIVSSKEYLKLPDLNKLKMLNEKERLKY